MSRFSSARPLLVAVALVAALGVANASAAPPPQDGGALEGVLLTTSLSPAYVPPGAPVTVEASAPALVGQELRLQEYEPTGWSVVAHTLVPGSGTVTFHLARWRSGAYFYRVVWPELGTNDPTGILSGATHQLIVTSRGLGDPRAFAVTTYHGHPVRWDPCRTITYRVDSAGAPATAASDLQEAFRRLAQATGLRFRNLGDTRQVYGASGFHWDADIDVAWTSARETPVLNGSSEAAVGGAPDGTVRNGRAVYRHGFVVIDRATVSQLPAGFGAGATQGLVLLHELGHVVGLRHVNAVDQVMQPTPQSDLRAALYGAGDLSGLAAVGARSGCT